jgi:tRNA/rRNA methyltransferase
MTERDGESGMAGPAIVLVRPQLPENVGAAARAMANFGLADLRLVAPRELFPNAVAVAAAAGADHVITGARVFPTVAEAIADLTLVHATTARERGQAKPVDGPTAAIDLLRAHARAGERVGVLFGPERTGLENDEVSLADRILTFPVDPAFASLNLGQAVLLVAYEWFKTASEGRLPFETVMRSAPASKGALLAFFAHIEGELDRAGYLRPPEKRAGMIRNLRNIFHRRELTAQDLSTLHGVVDALVEPRVKGVRRGRRVLGPVAGDEEA